MMDKVPSKYFVLRPHRTDYEGLAARMAILAYAAIMARHDPEMCQGLRDWMERIDQEHLDEKQEMIKQ